jgi:hypothetical protein
MTLTEPCSEDFHYSNAHLSFSNLDRVIKYFSEHPEYNLEVFYSTPSRYFAERYADLKKSSRKLSVKTDDFFPYEQLTPLVG